jgi:hypothetical protein
VALTTADRQHYSGQLTIRSALLRQLLVAWRAMNINQPDEAFIAWADAVLRLIVAHRAYSAALANQYVRAARAAAGIPGLPPAIPVPPLDVQKARQALAATALGTIKSARARAIPAAKISQLGYTNSSAAATRLALDAGREVVISSVEQDQRAVRWMRVTSGNPCAFCAVLAAGGGRYLSEETASFHPHGSCRCTAKPVYDRAETPPELSQSFAQMWDDVTVGLKGKEAFNAFRRAHEEAYGL